MKIKPTEEKKVIAFVKTQIQTYDKAHDWHHIQRVWNTAKFLASEEKADLDICSLGALLHEVGDHKFFDGNEEVAEKKVNSFLRTLALDEDDQHHILQIIRHISFKGGQRSPFKSLEFQVVQDADRLDAIGAIGIARTFHYGGSKGRVIYDPTVEPEPGQSKEAYINSQAPTINHFYEKLLLLKDLMHTETAKRIAEERHAYMQNFLQQFYKEWRFSMP